ncbi:hypothetical protein [Filifactor villosus]|uniref:Uncharacterized protein n=1 Tax=Filifactor villosus TaxID=29374 RepID=A0ABV9QIZ4_9FIRM
MNMEMVLSMFSDLALTIAIALTTLLFTTTKKFLLEKIALIRDEKQQNLALNALKRIDDIAEKTVKMFDQTVVQDLKNASADGKLTKAEIEDIQRKTSLEINALMSSDLRKALAETVGDVDVYIKALTEAKVLDLKKDFITIRELERDLETSNGSATEDDTEAIIQ